MSAQLSRNRITSHDRMFCETTTIKKMNTKLLHLLGLHLALVFGGWMPGRPEIKPIAIDPVSHSPPFPRSTLDHGFYLCHREEKSCGFPTNGRVPLTVNGEYLTRSVVPLYCWCSFFPPSSKYVFMSLPLPPLQQQRSIIGTSNSYSQFIRTLSSA